MADDNPKFTFTGTVNVDATISETLERTTALRIVRSLIGGFGGRQDRLQQAWVSHKTGQIEWRDIDVVYADPEGNILESS